MVRVVGTTVGAVFTMNAGWLVRGIKMLALAAVVACTGCAAAADANESVSNDESTASTQQAITNGEDDNADPAVVALLLNGKIFCTGVLVSPSIVATAAHCISPTPPDQVYFGSKPSTKKGSFIAVTNTKIHPDFDEETLVNDIAVIGLASKAPVAPLPVLKTAFDDSFNGMAIRIVGFGATAGGEQTNLRKRTGDTTINTFGDDEFRLQPKPSQTCNGDSGGPALAMIDGEETVVGIASSGDSECSTYGRHIRIDAFVPFLRSYTKSYRNPESIAAAEEAASGCSMTTHLPARGASAAAFLLAFACAFAARRRLRS